MCEFLKFRKLRSQLRDYEKKKGKAYDELERAVDIQSCGICNCYNNGTVKTHVDRFASCNCTKSDELKKIAARVDRIEAEADDFAENKYAYEVFLYYSQKKPNLIRNADDEVVSWKEAFGDKFDEVPKTLKQSLIGLVEKFGRYRLM